jgi:pimeloyl-ACP methyl ester carboxylesterase
VRGERSGYVDAREAGRLEAAGCPVETVSDAGHFLHVERPAAVLDALTRHFTGTGTG